MGHKIPQWSKRLIIFCFGLVIFILVLFFIFIAPQKTTPILMYHYISDIEEKGEILSLSKNVFKKHMEYLSSHSYNVISLKDLGNMLKKGVDIPDNCVILTFDDGYKDFYTQAYPILKQYKFNATIFVVADFLGTDEKWLDWKQVKKLSKEGLVDIGGHTLTHKALPLLGEEEARKEILFSKLHIEKRMDKPVDSFSYPYGVLNDSIKEMVKKAGYEVAVGTAYQRGEFKNNDVYILKRVFVSNVSRHPIVFKFMLSGYYVPTREFVLRILNIKSPSVLAYQIFGSFLNNCFSYLFGPLAKTNEQAHLAKMIYPSWDAAGRLINYLNCRISKYRPLSARNI